MGEIQPGITAFPESEANLRECLMESPIDATAFKKPMKRCTNCNGMCCYHGVHLSDEQAEMLRAIAVDNREYFESIGVSLPEEVVIEGVWRGEPSGWKTELKPWNYRENLPWFPAHWDNTACVFLNPKGYCGLQIYSKDCGQHPWYYKPLTCWLHPVNFPEEGGITIYDETNDPTIYPDYPGFNIVTHCGKSFEDGLPAVDVLQEELAFLGEIVGRDFVSEIKNQQA